MNIENEKEKSMTKGRVDRSKHLRNVETTIADIAKKLGVDPKELSIFLKMHDHSAPSHIVNSKGIIEDGGNKREKSMTEGRVDRSKHLRNVETTIADMAKKLGVDPKELSIFLKTHDYNAAPMNAKVNSKDIIKAEEEEGLTPAEIGNGGLKSYVEDHVNNREEGIGKE